MTRKIVADGVVEAFGTASSPELKQRKRLSLAVASSVDASGARLESKLWGSTPSKTMTYPRQQAHVSWLAAAYAVQEFALLTFGLA